MNEVAPPHRDPFIGPFTLRILPVGRVTIINRVKQQHRVGSHTAGSTSYLPIHLCARAHINSDDTKRRSRIDRIVPRLSQECELPRRLELLYKLEGPGAENGSGGQPNCAFSQENRQGHYLTKFTVKTVATSNPTGIVEK